MLYVPGLWYRIVNDKFATTSHDLVKTLEELNNSENGIQSLPWEVQKMKNQYFQIAS